MSVERFQNGLNMSLADVGCSASGAAATLTLAAATVAVIKGEFATVLTSGAKTIAFVETKTVPSSDSVGWVASVAKTLYGGASTNANAPANNKGQMAILVHCINAAGTFKSIQGDAVQMDASGLAIAAAPQFPMIPDTLVPFAYQVLYAGLTAGDIVPGTSNWNATGFTNTCHDIMMLPKRPVVA